MKMFHRFLAILLLVAYASTGTSMFSVAIWSLAVIDGSHGIQVCETEHGTCIRLHHSEADFTPNVADHPSGLGQFVVSLCSETDHGDHTYSAAHLTTGRPVEKERDEAMATVSSKAAPVMEERSHRFLIKCFHPLPAPRFALEVHAVYHKFRTLPSVRMLI